jgi:hypothetical protein
MIIAAAGRRIDAADTKEPRFPLRNVHIVATRVRRVLDNRGATAVVCSAACGADLIVLSEAGALGLRRKVVLPFDRERFRATSVTDRPGDWGALYEQILNQVEAAGDLVVIHTTGEDEAYSATNRTILDEAISLSHQFRESVTALLVWNGSSRGNDDLTEGFGIEARNRGLPVAEVRTDQSDTVKE